MGTTVRAIIESMESWAPSGLAYSWDKIGLTTGAMEQSVSKVLTALTINRDTLKAARRAKVELIVAHHPLIWEPVSTLRRDDPKSAFYCEIVESGIATYAAHTNLDVAEGGVNHILANRLDLTNLSPLFPVPQANLLKLSVFVPGSHLTAIQQATADAGAGVIGEYTHCGFHSEGTGTFKPGDAASPYTGKRRILNSEPEVRFETTVSPSVVNEVLSAMRTAHPYEEVAYDLVQLENTDNRYALGLIGQLPKTLTLDTFAGRVKKSLKIEHVRVTGKGKAKVKKIAVMGGAGGDSAPRVPSDVDVFVTGDIKYHDALDAYDAGLNLIDAGHHGTEKWIVPAIRDHLKKTCPGVKVSAFMEADPFRVL